MTKRRKYELESVTPRDVIYSSFIPHPFILEVLRLGSPLRQSTRGPWRTGGFQLLLKFR